MGNIYFDCSNGLLRFDCSVGNVFFECDTTTTTTTTTPPSSIVFLNNGSTPTSVYSFAPATSALTFLFTSSGASSDIASTSNKMWVRTALGSTSLYEYDITVDPFTYSFNRLVTNVPNSSGLAAWNDTTLITMSTNNVYLTDITTQTGSSTLQFACLTGRTVQGDFIRTLDGHFIVLTANSTGSPTNHVTQYNWSTGALEVDTDISSLRSPYGIYQFDNEIYWINSDGVIYKVNKNSPWGSTAGYDIPVNVNGASQDPLYLTTSLNF